MRHTLALLLLLTSTACQIEQELISLPNDPVIAPGDSVDLVFIFDTSCSMMSDWTVVDYGLIRTAEDFQSANIDVQLAMTTADSMSQTVSLSEPVWIEADPSNDVGWEVAMNLDEARSAGAGGEAGIDGIIQAWDYHSDWFRDDAFPVFIAVSDEHEQSTLTVDDLYATMPRDSIYVTIVGPNDPEVESECNAEYAPVYHSFAHVAVDVCVGQQWSILEEVLDDATF